MPPTEIPFITACEGCGQENEQLVGEVRRFRALRGVKPKMVVAPLRSPFLCEQCIALLPGLLALARGEKAMPAPSPPADCPQGGRVDRCCMFSVTRPPCPQAQTRPLGRLRA